MYLNGEQLLKYTIYAYRLSFFIGICSLFIAKSYLPEFLQYGKTYQRKRNSKYSSILERFKKFTVPKAYFSHFYYLATFLSLITLYFYPKFPIVWIIFGHSLRRLYETLYVLHYTSKSRMNWSHYLVGIWFYSVLLLILNISLYRNTIPNTLNTSAFIIFCIASWDQYKNHHILAQLVKYSLPTGRLFSLVCCPHYLDEIIIYSTLLPYEQEFYLTLVWVIASLTISALETQNYYRHKFKDNHVARYSIIPFII
ncbi:AVB_G0027210.mRNA.1.CDS.1 [Saccharomyces cerevisiae]|uniref:Polyprenal reductase n=1 Tax=Saccharomyces paradoxus TaxID=27291 RepID=A0A8B8UT85_SACPA|nr:Dfg10 [Saccharomyces paradoxus]AJP39419.1 Dfg10p [Saccharomyces cerevisiae YJM1078]AJR37438.1 Dfg10p [Saccharomyces cerevisiae YJM248]CAI4388199.1 CPG_1a_G0026890.mRNA.1.CDS.1 [Saccharomyces cerevisiae]QHS73963.1 Dfg10 [Saccharomyces paradoxus]CAI4399033.1 AIE_G0026900.mRNA.1.CDS.1 [Saccharomyces cerevisiae]